MTRSEEMAREKETAGQGLSSVVAKDFDVWKAMGGVRGLVETALPVIAFVGVYVVTKNVTWSVAAPLVFSFAAIVLRLIQRKDVTPAFSGLLAIALSVAVVHHSGKVSHYFLLGILLNSAYLAGLLISVLFRWPAMGLIIGFFRGDPTGWKRGEWARTPDGQRTRRAYWRITWLWVGVFALRIAVQLPLLLMGSVAILGAMRIAMGPFLFALAGWVTWIIVRTLPAVPHSPDDDVATSNSDGEA